MHFSTLISTALCVSTSLVGALKIASNLETIEYTPELVAIQDYLDKSVSASIVSGGVPNLFSDSSLDLASNAETQALRNYASHKNLRIIYTVAEVYYRIVANKAKGISVGKDLKGKRVGCMQSTSAAYFLNRYLASVGLKDSDVTVVSGSTCNKAPCGSGTLPVMLTQGSIDAIAMWEPTIEIAAQALGANAVVLQDKSVYRELFNLHSTTEKLSNPTTRKAIVTFIKALNQAEKVFATNFDSVQARVASAVRIDPAILKAVYPVHLFNGTLAADTLDVIIEEDKWIARLEGRAGISAADLAKLIDRSVLEEALQT